MKRVLLDPGHSEKRTGARGKNASIHEEEMNRYQAECLKRELSALNISVTIVDPMDDDLITIGLMAEGYDAFISLHLNAYNNKAEYTCAMCHNRLQRPTGKSAKIAGQWAKAIGDALHNPVFGGTQGWPVGVMAAGLSVLNGASHTSCPIAFLSEAEFIDNDTDVAQLKVKLKKAMAAGAKVLAYALG